MPSPSPAHLTPALRCPRCKQPFKIPLDKLGVLAKCKLCQCRFRVSRDKAGAYAIHEEGAAARPASPAPKIAPPRTPSGTNQQASSPTTSYPSAVPANNDADRTVMGKPTAPPTMRPGEPLPGDADRTMMGKPVAHLPDWLADCTPDGRGRAPMSKPTAPPTSGRPRQPSAAPAPPATGKAAAPAPRPPTARRLPTPKPAASAKATPSPPGNSGGRWKWVVALAGGFILVLGGLAAAYFLLPSGKAAPASLVSLGKYGGIEIGSTGVKRVGVEYYKTDKGVVESLLDEPKDINPKIADLPEGADSFNDRAFQLTVDQVGDYYDALENLGVPTENILVVCSSGVLAPFKTDEVAQRNHDRLVKAIRLKLPKLGKDPEFIDAHDEAKFSFQETVKPDEWDDSVVVDVGGNNIKGGGFVRKDNFLDFSVMVGSSSFEKKVNKDIKDHHTGESFLEAALRLRPVLVEAPLHADLSAVDQLTKRKKVHLIGGIPWAMATYVEPDQFYAAKDADGGASYHCKLAAADIDLFDRMVRTRKPEEIKRLVESKAAEKGLDKHTSAAVDENVEKLQTEVFKNQDRLVGGAQILLAIDKEFSLQAENKDVRSFRYGQVAWLLGYVKSRSGHMQ